MDAGSFWFWVVLANVVAALATYNFDRSFQDVERRQDEH